MDPNAMPGQNIPMGFLGTVILFFGWFGFNPGSSLAFDGWRTGPCGDRDDQYAAGRSGGLYCMAMALYVDRRAVQKSLTRVCRSTVFWRGSLPSRHRAFVDPWAAVLIGCFAGVIVCLASFALEKGRD